MSEKRTQAEESLKPQFQMICIEIEDQLRQSRKAPVLVAIDGQCASGKTTLGEMLARRFDCNLFHMDDFFLQAGQRTPQRLAEVGGNVDYERFRSEVLEPVLRQEEAVYRVYDCKTQRLAAEVKAPVKRLNIIEGSYSRHPYFGRCYDLAYCLLIGEEEQEKRLLERNGERMLKRFKEEWIPKENAYLARFKIRDRQREKKEETSYAANQRTD